MSLSSYDAWKLASPPYYEFDGDNPLEGLDEFDEDLEPDNNEDMDQ